MVNCIWRFAFGSKTLGVGMQILRGKGFAVAAAAIMLVFGASGFFVGQDGPDTSACRTA